VLLVLLVPIVLVVLVVLLVLILLLVLLALLVLLVPVARVVIVLGVQWGSEAPKPKPHCPNVVAQATAASGTTVTRNIIYYKRLAFV
jgi:uncharacterized membrane protein YqiK